MIARFKTLCGCEQTKKNKSHHAADDIHASACYKSIVFNMSAKLSSATRVYSHS